MKNRFLFVFVLLSIAGANALASERAIQSADTQRATQSSGSQRAIDPPTQQRSAAPDSLQSSPSTNTGVTGTTTGSVDSSGSGFESDSRELSDKIEQRRKNFENN